MPPKKNAQRKAVCCCITHGCHKHCYINDDQESQPGVILSINAVKLHQLDDEKAKLAELATPTHVDSDALQIIDSFNSISLSPHSSSISSSNLDSRTPTLPQDQVNLSSSKHYDRLIETSSSQPYYTPKDAAQAEQLVPQLCQGTEPNATVLTYDCSRFFSSLESSRPTTVHVALVASIFSIVYHCSNAAIAWFLSSQQNLLNLVLTRSFVSPTRELFYHEKSIIQEIPRRINTIMEWLDLDPVLTRLICCKQCFAMYPIGPNIPLQCAHKSLPSTLQITDSIKNPESTIPDNITPELVCCAPLFKSRGNHPVPIRTYAHQDLHAWLAKLFSRPHIEEALELTAKQSHIRFDHTGKINDIHHSQSWKQFSGPCGKQFTSSSNNLTFGLYTDAINAFGNRQAGKHASVTFLILICLSLPVHLRSLPENVFIAGIAPGPSEPSLEQINWILQPVVHQLNSLWDPGLYLSRTHAYPNGRHIRGALLTVLGDLPAIRRVLGFSSASSNHFCSYCLLTRDEMSNFESKSWPRRESSNHRTYASQSRDAKSDKEKEKIFREHGVRYSAVLELEYWDIISFHCVDPMHNLLLGLLKWHCQRFWAMEDVANEPEPQGVSTRELVDLLVDNTRHSSGLTTSEPNTHQDDFNMGLSWLFDVDGYSTSDDEDFSPIPCSEDWKAEWQPLSDGEIVIDSHALAFINEHLPLIHVPSWIKQALPVLGKASFGRIKADEWRNLFTIQLPLILPFYWRESELRDLSLLHNFAHLVSLVNLALKRQINSEIISKYNHHLTSYLESSLKVFEGQPIAPNHHMALHLAECLERFGPVRSWWSFPLERLMGQVLQACSNNRLGELEETFLTTFCRLGNLRVLLESDKLPDDLKPFIAQLRTFSEPPVCQPQSLDPCSRSQILSPNLFSHLVKKINLMFSTPDDGCIYVESNKWRHKKTDKNAPINARVELLRHLHVAPNLTYSPFSVSPKNSIIQFREALGAEDFVFGQINQIFKHRRVNHHKQARSDTWLVVSRFPPVPQKYNLVSQFSPYHLQLALCLFSPQTPEIIHIKQIISHCAWIRYSAAQISPALDQDCIAVVSLDRS